MAEMHGSQTPPVCIQDNSSSTVYVDELLLTSNDVGIWL